MLVSTLIGLALSSLAQAALILGQAQFNSGDVLPSTIIAVNDDLLQTSVATVTGDTNVSRPRNGTTGTASENTGTNPAKVWYDSGLDSPAIYNLDVAVNTLGYDIQEIRLFSGWDSGRAGQSYEIFYSLVGDPGFVSLGTVSALNGATGSMMTRTYDSEAGMILTGVDAIRFDQINNGVAGTGTVFREFDVIGVPYIPEPSSLAILGLGAVGFFRVFRRRRT